jgi:HPt (histidine-containing phosphotransfer) domain-containing protein
MMAELEQAIEAKDMVGIQNIGHAIKGTAGMYGFMNMSDIAACIEQNARDQNINKLPMLYNQIASLFKQLSNPNCSQGTG